MTTTLEERDRIIDKVAHEIVKRKLEAPAIMMLEMNKPLTFIASQSILVAMPILGAFIEPDKVEKLSELLKNEDNVELLIRRIEDLAEDRKGNSADEDRTHDMADADN